MSHNDYKYLETQGGHMPKAECYGSFAAFDKSGRPIPCSTAISSEKAACDNRPISQHPQYEATIRKYGAVKGVCGNWQVPSHTPCNKIPITQHPEYEATIKKYGAVKDTCGRWQVPRQKACKTTSNCSGINAELIRERMKYRLLLERYNGQQRK